MDTHLDVQMHIRGSPMDDNCVSNSATEAETIATEDRVEHRILFLLSHYPIISPTMLQIALGPQVPTRIWRPILAKLIDQGIVNQKSEIAETHLGQTRSLTKLSLNGTLVTKVNNVSERSVSV